MLPKQTAAFTFNAGVETKADPKTIQGKLLKLQNGFFQTPNMVRKRYGYQALPSPSAVGVGLNTFQGQLVALDGQTLYTLSSAAGAYAAPATPPVVTPIALTTTSVSHTPAQLGNNAVQDVCYHSAGYVVSLVPDAAFPATRYVVQDKASGATMAVGTVPYAAKAMAVGNYVVLIYSDNGSHLYYQALNMTSTAFTLGGQVTIASDVSGGLFDATVINGSAYIAYNASTGVAAYYLTSALSLSSKALASSESASANLTIFGDTANNACIGYSSGSNLKIVAYNAALSSQVIAPTVLDSGVTFVDTITGVASGSLAGDLYATSLKVVSGPAPWAAQVRHVSFNGSTPGTPSYTQQSWVLASKAFQQNGVNYAWGLFQSSQQPTYFLLNLSKSNVPVAKLSPGTAPMVGYLGGTLPEVATVSAGNYLYAYLHADEILLPGPTYTTALSIASFSFGGTPQSLEVGNNLMIAAGGILYSWDGLTASEQNFHLYPDSVTPTIASTTGGSVGAGKYSYVACYEFIDGQGQVTRSAPSLPQSPPSNTTGSTNQIAIAVNTLCLTQKQVYSKVQVVFYGTMANGTIYYRLGAVDNVVGTSAVTFTDTLSDTTKAGLLQLYTTGGEVDNGSVPAPLALCSFNNRLVVIPAETPDQFWYSKQVLSGVPVEMSSFFTENVDAKGGGLTAGIQMDDKLILFKATTAGFVVGSGPAPSGVNNDFSDWEPIAGCDVGTTNPASVVLMPDGVMFQSAKGISILDRSLGTSYIGAPVEGIVQGNTVVDARLYSTYSQVRFLLSNGVCVVYDYLLGQWYTYTDHPGVQACIYQGAYTYLTAGGAVLQESTSTFTDAGTFYPLLIQTSWLKFDVLQGYQRVYEMEVLGDWKSAHTLQVQVARDFNPAIIQTTSIVASSSQVPYQNRMRFQVQKCEALQLTIQDVQTANYGEGLDMSGLSFVVGVKGGRLNKVAAGQSY